jgi:hypothetical protein
LRSLVSSEHEEMRAMFYRRVRVIDDALSAKREYMPKDGQILDGGPDHYARLAATKHFRDFVTVGRPAPKRSGCASGTLVAFASLRPDARVGRFSSHLQLLDTVFEGYRRSEDLQIAVPGVTHPTT